MSIKPIGFRTCSLLLLLAFQVQLTSGAASGTWTPLTPATSYPSGYPGKPQDRIGYGGITYRPKTNGLLFYDGYLDTDHGFPSSIYANAMAEWKLGSNAIEVHAIAETNPTKRHTYEVFTYVEPQDALYMMKGANGGCGDFGMWRFSFSTKSWEEVQTTLPPTYACEGHQIYLKAQDKLVYVNSDGNAIYEFDFSSKVWSKVGSSKSPTSLYNAASTWDSKRNRWIFFNQTELVSYDPVSRVFSALPVQGGKPPTRGEAGITYISKYDAYMIAGGKPTSDTWVYSVSGQSWQQVSGGYIESGHTYLYYEAGADKVYALSTHRSFYTMVYSQSGGDVGDTQAPSVPSSLTAMPASSSQVNLSWTASVDNTSIAGYRIYRNGTQVTTTQQTTFSDTGLQVATTYNYQVSAFDSAGNVSSLSSGASATTLAGTGSSPPPPSSPPSAVNSIKIFNTSGATQVNRPVTISRPFRQGEINHFAQAIVNGNGVLTQCDVKNRWSDGSLKFAIISFIVPSLPSGGNVTVQFSDQVSGNNSGALTQSQMLDPAFDFEGTIKMTGSLARSVSARTMLGNGHWRYWLQGPIVTAVIIEDRTLGRSDDVDFGDGSKALHPIFEAWFYPENHSVSLGYTMENCWASSTASKSTRDLGYSLSVTSGNSSPVTRFTQSTFNHIGKTRWHKRFWVKDPGSIRVDHNLAYLVETRAIPNYDTSIVPSLSLETARYSSYLAESGTLDGSSGDPLRIANYSKGMNAAGAADWIGIHSTWEVLWLYSMSLNGYEMLLGNGDLAGRMPMFLREADSSAGTGKYFDQQYVQNTNLSTPGTPGAAGTVDTFGRIVSINARRSISFSSLTASQAGDAINVGAITSDGWGTIERNHQPDVCYLPYLFSGQYHYLECLQMQAAHNIGWKSVAWASDWARPGDVGLMNDTNVRGDAWGLKSVVHASFISPDGTPEQSYFIDKLRDNLAEWEGAQNVSLSYPSKQEVWNYGRNIRTTSEYWKFPNKQPSPLGQWSPGVAAAIQAPVLNNGTLIVATSPWEENFMLCILGRARETGVADTSGLLKFMAKKRFHMNLDNNVPGTKLGNFVEAYRDPTIEMATGNWIQNFQAFVSHYDHATEPYTGRRLNLAPDHSYAFIALAADSFLVDFTVDGLTGLNAYKANNASTPLQTQFIDSSPKWAIRPRIGGTSQPSVPPSSAPPAPPTNLTVN